MTLLVQPNYAIEVSRLEGDDKRSHTTEKDAQDQGFVRPKIRHGAPTIDSLVAPAFQGSCTPSTPSDR